VVDGLPADVVNFSLTPDMTKLVKAGIVSPSWNKNATKGFVTNSIVSFVVRKGNPKHITTWSDLVKSGVTVITPNPFSSGSAKWNLMAAYGAQLNQGKSKTAATAYLTQLLKHTAAQPSSASNALQTFLAGQGDVLLDYEDDALYAQSQGEPVTVITPPQTILIQNPIAVSAKASNPTVAKAFTAFLLSPAGQKIWGKQGYRPVLANVAATFNFPKPKTLFTIDSLGGWTAVNLKFFDPQTGVIATIEQGLGVSTASG
jgi:sulfate transport system substrate-binding protein